MPGDYGWINTYFWVPIVGPLIGAALAVPAYDIGMRKILIARAAAAEPPEGGRVPGETTPPGTLDT
jgi:glycerol uptake facilitator protein